MYINVFTFPYIVHVIYNARLFFLAEAHFAKAAYDTAIIPPVESKLVSCNLRS